MEYLISVEPNSDKPPIIVELVTCGECVYGKLAEGNRRCHLRGVIAPDVSDGDFCSFGSRR